MDVAETAEAQQDAFVEESGHVRQKEEALVEISKSVRTDAAREGRLEGSRPRRNARTDEIESISSGDGAKPFFP